jgi:hypothetical protein
MVTKNPEFEIGYPVSWTMNQVSENYLTANHSISKFFLLS